MEGFEGCSGLNIGIDESLCNNLVWVAKHFDCFRISPLRGDLVWFKKIFIFTQGNAFWLDLPTVVQTDFHDLEFVRYWCFEICSDVLRSVMGRVKFEILVVTSYFYGKKVKQIFYVFCFIFYFRRKGFTLPG